MAASKTEITCLFVTFRSVQRVYTTLTGDRANILDAREMKCSKHSKADGVVCVFVRCCSELTPRSTVLPEKLTSPQLAKKCLSCYETWRFFTAFTSAGHLSLSWASTKLRCSPHRLWYFEFLLALSLGVEDNIDIDLQVKWGVCTGFIWLRVLVSCRAIVNAVMNLRVP